MSITMNETLIWLFAWIAGVALGVIFFGGLWWTIRSAVKSPQPALWFFVSMLLRTSIALAGFYLVGGGHWQRLLVCLLGFIVARLLVTWVTRLSPSSCKRFGAWQYVGSVLRTRRAKRQAIALAAERGGVHAH